MDNDREIIEPLIFVEPDIIDKFHLMKSRSDYHSNSEFLQYLLDQEYTRVIQQSADAGIVELLTPDILLSEVKQESNEHDECSNTSELDDQDSTALASPSEKSATNSNNSPVCVLNTSQGVESPMSNDYITGIRNGIYACYLCTAMLFERPVDLQNHFRVCHPGADPYRCPECGLTFTSKPGITQHSLVHTNRTYNCDVCQNCFVSLQEKNRHMMMCEREHNSIAVPVGISELHPGFESIEVRFSSRKTSTCSAIVDSGAKRQKSNKHFRQHITNDVGESGITFNCLMCGNAYTSAQGLTAHMQQEHTGNGR